MCDLTFNNQSIFFDVKEEEKNLKHYAIYKTQQSLHNHYGGCYSYTYLISLYMRYGLKLTCPWLSVPGEVNAMPQLCG